MFKSKSNGHAAMMSSNGDDLEQKSQEGSDDLQ